MKIPSTIVAILTGLATVAPAESTWWSAYASDTLCALIETGLSSHPDPLAAIARVEAVQQERQRVAAAARPSAAVHVSARVGEEKTMYTDRQQGAIDPFAGSARISWELDLFGHVRHATAAAEARAAMSHADVQGIRLLLGTEIARLVFEVSASHQAEAIDREIRDATSRLADRAHARALAGLEAQPESDRARARVEMMKHMHMLTNIRLIKTLNHLNSLVGTNIVSASLPEIAAFKLPPQTTLDADRLVSGRPDVAAAWWQLQSFLSEAQSAKRAHAPTLALVASAAGEASEDGAEPWEAWIGPTVQIPLWRPDLRAVERRSLAEAQAARAHFASVSLVALREIEDARIDRTNAETMFGHLAARRDNLASAEATEKRKREAGLTQESDWLEARIAYLQAVREGIVWRGNALLAHLELIKALGGNHLE